MRHIILIGLLILVAPAVIAVFGWLIGLIIVWYLFR